MRTCTIIYLKGYILVYAFCFRCGRSEETISDYQKQKDFRMLQFNVEVNNNAENSSYLLQRVFALAWWLIWKAKNEEIFRFLYDSAGTR